MLFRSTAPSSATGATLTFTLTARSAAGLSATDVVVVNVAPPVDVVAMTRAQYTVGKNQWQAQGTASLRLGQTITVYLGAAGDTARRIGSAVVDGAGRWLINTANGSGPAPAAADTTVWAQSSLGGAPVTRTFTRG